MIPLAVSGTAVIGVTVGCAVLLFVALLRVENRADRREARERNASREDDAGR